MGNPQVQLYQTLVTHFGSQENTATALLVKQPAVSGWVCGTKKMSAQTALRAERATQGAFKASDLCPALKEFQNLSA
ncbi:helix-turn-helix domain-containing protein [Acinetobacter bohemicus]|uniref:Putative antitoxin of toxin-antitoxin system, YdaS/YdaT n=1 Tax=Acinetobacter bohemicus TaxID=1435036 RepID=A0A1I6WDA6_9GAMM|nr:Cro/CI family transcriptional regulator [Acinetobacter bohemicus]KAB0650125.1 helix-turn-helix domain-containing protein [Acinetobacter bohemicus]SFT23975.1 Putative antitoxin of toxin-antitoxin system, YdaS/YdaT [Acinetobacter bohemicus]